MLLIAKVAKFENSSITSDHYKHVNFCYFATVCDKMTNHVSSESRIILTNDDTTL